MIEHYDVKSYEPTLNLSVIKNSLKSEFDINLKNIQIQEICHDLVFQVVIHRGYPKVKRNDELLKKLVKERSM